MSFLLAETNETELLDSGARKKSTADDYSAEILERLLLLAFMFAAAISVGWHLSVSLHWVWANCAAQLHSAVLQSGLVSP